MEKDEMENRIIWLEEKVENLLNRMLQVERR